MLKTCIAFFQREKLIKLLKLIIFTYPCLSNFISKCIYELLYNGVTKTSFDLLYIPES